MGCPATATTLPPLKGPIDLHLIVFMRSGLTFKFWYCAAAIDAHNWVIKTTGNSNYFVGGLGHADTTADDNAESLFSNGSSNSAVTVVKPGTGSWVEVGTAWCNCRRQGLAGFPAVAGKHAS